jgi:hypothetical protein
MSEEITKYQKEWDDYRNRIGNGCAAMLIILFIVAAVVLLSRLYPAIGEFLEKALFFIFATAIIGYLVFFSFRYESWKCPRCKNEFEWYKRQGRQRFCNSCGLPKYYGSAYYYNKWGKAVGQEMADKVGKGDL